MRTPDETGLREDVMPSKTTMYAIRATCFIWINIFKELLDHAMTKINIKIQTT